MGLPSLTLPRILLVLLVLVLIPWAIVSLSNGHVVTALMPCLLYPLVGRYAIPPNLRRVFAAVLVAIGVGTLAVIPVWDNVVRVVPQDGPAFWGLFVRAVSVLVCYGFGVGVTWLGLLILVTPAAHFIQGVETLTEDNRETLRRFLISQFLEIGQTYQIVADGKVITSKPAGALTALADKGLLIIAPGNAVVTEWGGNIRQILGPGIDKTIRFERVAHVVDLYPQRIEKEFDAQTLEGVPVKATVVATYRIRRSPIEVASQGQTPPLASGGEQTKASPGHNSGIGKAWRPFSRSVGVNKPNAGIQEQRSNRNAPDPNVVRLVRSLGLPQPNAEPLDVEAVLKAVYCSVDKGWQLCAEDAIKTALTSAVNTCQLADIYAVDGNSARNPIVESLSKKIWAEANHLAYRSGVTISRLAVTSIHAEADTRSKALEPLLALAQADALATRGAAQVSVAQRAEAMRSEVRSEEIKKMVELLRDQQGKVPEEQLLRAATIAARLAGAMALHGPDNGLRLIQATEEALSGLLEG